MSTTPPPAADPPARLRLALLARPRVLAALLLGFGSGLPFYLVGNTLGFWLRGAGWDLASIGFLSWAGLAYSLKVFWAPVVDRTDVPVLGRLLGRRRGWLVLSQLAVAGGLAGMALIGPGGGLTLFAAFTLLTAFASSTQDIVADAWRIERADSAREQGLLTSTFQLGYRAALLVADSLILLVAGRLGWANSYLAAAAAMGVGLGASLLAEEPLRTASPASGPPLASLRGLADAVGGPFLAFFRAHGQLALVMLAAISLYRLADFVMGPMAAPFYTDLGLSTDTVGGVRLSVGLVASFLGIAAAGLSAVRLGPARTLVLGAVLGPLSNLAFTAMALSGPSVALFAAAIAVDNLSAGFAGAALVAYMSGLTSRGYTATQYALLSSTYSVLGKLAKGLSGTAVEWLHQGRGLLEAYAWFFAATALIGVPAIALSLVLGRHADQLEPAAPP